MVENRQNLSQPNEATGAMPSYFQSLTSSESFPLPDWQFLLCKIQSDAQLQAYTETYRKRLAISKPYADELKASAPAFTVSVQTDGYGRKLANIKHPTHLLMVDVDKVPRDRMDEVWRLIIADPHTLLAYRTVSGKGFRIICPYSPIDDEDISLMELFEVVVDKAISHFADLLHIMPDKACRDITRCSGLAFDPDAYLNPQADSFSLGALDLKALYTNKTKNRRRTRKATTPNTSTVPKETTPKGSSSNGEVPSMNEAADHIRELLASWGLEFCPGRHNEYVLNLGKVCVLYGIDRQEALAYADRELGTEYPDTAAVIKSCYKHTERLGLWEFLRPGERRAGKVTVRTVKQWLGMRYEIHRNVVTGFYEVRSRNIATGKFPRWTQLDDTVLNSLWTEMDEGGLHTSAKMLDGIINSDFSEPFDPLEDYLRSLAPWQPGDPDYIGQLADRIMVEPLPESHHTQDDFRYFFRKWFVGMVVAWTVTKVVNQIILILVGKGGIFKTTFFTFLLPPCLKPYFMNDSTGSYVDKDFMEALSSKAAICLDEFESVFGKNLSAFKSNITKLTFSLRRPYDKYRSELPHRASLCGTTNTLQFITDEENRRYSPWLVRSIQSPMERPIDYDRVYAQALALGREVMQRRDGTSEEWVYWLTADDIGTMRQHNRMFMVANYAEEQIRRFYRVPDKDTNPRYVKFRYSAEILERIGTSPALRQKLSNQDIGSIMARLGFEKVHRNRGNGWAVIEKDGAEINTDSIM